LITETVLEMHYHKPLMDLFRSTFGLGNTGSINFYKYSPQRECFIGFDQAYARTELSEEAFFRMLRNSAASSDYRLEDKFVGYFLQFKVVKEKQKRNKKYTPTSIVNRPHYRVDLETKRDLNTGLSQHELLYNLNQQNPGAMVYYACPMVFDRSALYDIDVDLDALSLADLDSCPSSYDDNDNHFIYYNDMQANPVWCSDPVDGKAVLPRELAAILDARLRHLEPEQSAAELLKLLTHLEAVGLSPQSEAFRERSTPSVLPLVAESLSILRVAATTKEKPNLVTG
jgi:hypothetical protein